MAKALWEHQPADDEDGEDTWENTPEWVKACFRSQARAALLALAEVELPEKMEIENGGLMYTRLFHFDQKFRFALRAIAEEGKA